MYSLIQRFFTIFAIASLAAIGASACKPKPAAAGPAGGPPVMQVVVVPAKTQSVAETVSLVGNLLADESVEIKSEIDGTVVEVNFKEGQAVEKGAVLIRLDESKLTSALAEAEANLKLAQSNHERAQQLSKEKLISQQEFDQASSTFQSAQATVQLRRQLLKDAKIVAPFAGIVGARNISPGQVILKITVLTWLTDLDPIKVEMSVPERYVGALKVGQEVAVKVAAYPQQKYSGQVYFIAQNVDAATRTALAKAEVPNPKAELKPGMFANLDLTLSVRSNAVVIPEAALSRVIDGNRAMVFVVDDTSTAQMKAIKLGVRLPGQVEVLDGIKPGENVIVEGTQKIGPGSKVKVAPPETAAPYQNPGQATPARS